MAKNRLNLNFNLNTNKERAEFVQQYLNQPQFTEKPLTATESETIANYILYGRNESGKNDVQEKSIHISTKHGNWESTHPTESLEALVESPTFNEAQLNLTPTHYIKKNEKFSRSAALANSSPELAAQFTALFKRIDLLDLAINYYELANEKRTEIRQSLLDRLTPEEHSLARNAAASFTPYTYLKRRHELVELRREQYTLRDSVTNTITRHTLPIPPHTNQTTDWGAEIRVLPLGLMCAASSLIFKDPDQLRPASYTEDELAQVSKYYWSYQDQPNPPLSFDFRNLEDVYQLFLAFYDAEDASAAEDVHGNAKQLITTLNYYITLADLTEMQHNILEQKIKQVRNQDIAYNINKKYSKSYTANYISTIFRQKIIPQINAAARIHEETISKIYFSEEFKTCTCCGRTYLRTAEFFVRKARSSDGLSSRCKKCDKQDRMEKKVIELVKR